MFVLHRCDGCTMFASCLHQVCLIDVAAAALRATVMGVDPLGWRFLPVFRVCGTRLRFP